MYPAIFTAKLGQALAQPLLEVRGLVKHYPVRKSLRGGPKGLVKAVDGVDLYVLEGETLGLVGESGCGKSTLARQIIRLEKPTAGQVFFQGRNILSLKRAELKELRQEMQLIFQDPFSSLNPRLTVGQIVEEPLDIHRIGEKSWRREEMARILGEVGLSAEHAERFPHEFSGGQRQRIGIARALILKPKLIIADEPISALDVSIQAQVLNLLKELQNSYGLTYIFIAHDLSVVRYISDRIAVMYLGRIVEVSQRDHFSTPPIHPYTEALLSANPVPDPTAKPKRIILAGDVPSPSNPPEGCRFHTRCPLAVDPICFRIEPAMVRLRNNRLMACHRRAPAEGVDVEPA